MLFNSYIFVFVFLPLAIIGYYLLNQFNKYGWAETYLIGMSLWFYGYFNPVYLPIMVFSILINYGIGLFLLSHGNRYKFKKSICVLGILGNVLLLFYFKYMGFFVENINGIFNTDYNVVNIMLPLGISFFTFQQLSYVVDCYRGEVPKYAFRQYALFVTFFPQLIAGPIVLHNETVPQFADYTNRKWNWDNFAIGIMAFIRGMGKKVLIADTLGNAVNWGYSDIGSLNTTTAICVVLSYTLQIYFDFSGYCDVAIGIGKMFNINIPINFNSPYKAFSVTDFWKRWHITLTRFLRTYIYFPLGGNRKGVIRTYGNLFTVFLVSGLWHGANYTFLVWGILHGVVMILERINSEKRLFTEIHPALSWASTFAFINVSWIFFRADSVNDAMVMIKNILRFDFGILSKGFVNALNLPELELLFKYSGSIGDYLMNVYPFYLLTLILAGTLYFKNTAEKMEQFKYSSIDSIYYACIMVYCIISFSGISTFLYFNF